MDVPIQLVVNQQVSEQVISVGPVPLSLPHTSPTTINPSPVEVEKKRKPERSPTTIRCLKKIKVLNQKVRRQKKKISSLKDLLSELKKKRLLEDKPSSIIESNFDGLLCDVFKNEVKNKNKSTKGRRYSPEMKKFALTLLYYSLKAYNFCRTIFTLPHPTSIKNWTSSVNAEPGFLSDVFEELSKLPLDDRDCNLVLDGMAIRSQVIWDRVAHTFVGYCDYGNAYNIEGSETPATEVLVFMLVALNGKWKWPVGYFLLTKLQPIYKPN